jgi:hypothetical protein
LDVAADRYLAPPPDISLGGVNEITVRPRGTDGPHVGDEHAADHTGQHRATDEAVEPVRLNATGKGTSQTQPARTERNRPARNKVTRAGDECHDAAPKPATASVKIAEPRPAAPTNKPTPVPTAANLSTAEMTTEPRGPARSSRGSTRRVSATRAYFRAVWPLR